MSRRILGWVLAAALLQCVGAASAASAASRRRPAARHAQPVDPTVGDDIDGDDLTVRRAAVEALGSRRGSIVVVDPSNGRVLTMVGQKLALQSGFIPCSTIKLVTALAALTEHVVDRDTFIRIGRYTSYNLTTALARSNNEYFGALGSRLGFERVIHYARMMGLGEKAGLDISGEQPGEVAADPPKGSMVLMTAYGEGFQMTPLELAALLSAIANGGTLYYLQYPRTQEDIDRFSPRVKRELEIRELIPEIKPGMAGAVEFGTARRAKQDEVIMGKTGTCSEGRTHLGWFGSFNDSGPNKLVVVVLLTGGKPSIGPMAAGVAGDVYRHLAQQNYFAANHTAFTPAALVATPMCCAR